jgi:dihydroorotate dehydrogenase (NAD+) catalytic subunit
MYARMALYSGVTRLYWSECFMKKTDLKVNIAGISLKNPVIAASGTFGFGHEYAQFIDIEKLGGISVKGLTLESRKGNPPPRIAETPGGILNSVGLQNPGVKNFIEKEIPYLRQFDTALIANIAGNTVDEYVEMAGMLSGEDIDAIELNVSCPNVKAGGMAFGTTCEGVEKIVSNVRRVLNKPLIVKLTPNVTDIKEIAKAAESAGADAISLINTIQGMKIDIKTKRPVLANNFGGLSGPAVMPVAVRMVYETAVSVNIPVIGMGGIVTGADAVEFMLAGASAVMVGTANFIKPEACVDVIAELEKYLEENNYDSVYKIIGKVEMYQ